ncbi:MAG: DUF86 domain-containing protein [Methanomicrobiales archaeon]|nr:DUF86 domain-containing protein [Methanomicrobiales archaeon]MDI6876653.1 DUF86 domain-containing protein [Methanomicrobiales archaeon]
MVDVDLLKRWCGEVRQTLRDLERIVRLGEAEFLSNPYVRDAAKYRLIVAIEGAISICSHVDRHDRSRRYQTATGTASCSWAARACWSGTSPNAAQRWRSPGT